MKAEAIGTIGNPDQMKPQIREFTVTNEDGSQTKKKIVTFKIFEVGGAGSIQVNLNYSDWAEGIFKNLSSGRKVYVRGSLSHNPNKRFNGDQIEVFVNPTIWANEVFLLDTPASKQFRQYTALMSEKSYVFEALIENIQNGEFSEKAHVIEFLEREFTELSRIEFEAGRIEPKTPEDYQTENPMEEGAIQQ